jgi:hypothetical protein
VNQLVVPHLYRNGALDADNWGPSYDNLRHGLRGTPPEEGDLVGWRYGAWRVVEAKPVPETDLCDEEQERLDTYLSGLREEVRPRVFVAVRPRITVLRHESGPLILKAGEPSQRLHNGSRTVHFRTKPLATAPFAVLADPHRVCSCHGHVWACQEVDRSELAAVQMRQMDRLIATTQPGVCANCLEPITTRQRTVTFPEESRFVPGAPGPTFHAGRAACWGAAERYERKGRLADDPDIPRLASCPGVRFIHERLGLPAEQRTDCTAGPFCTGLHGPAGYRQTAPCWYRVDLAGNEGAFARPTFDCGYRSGDQVCLGGDLSSGGTSISPIAADLLWEQDQRRRGGSGG